MQLKNKPKTKEELIMSKSFVEACLQTSKTVCQCEKDGVGMAPMDLPLQVMVTDAISKGISTALYLKMAENPTDRVSVKVGPFEYCLDKVVVGGTCSFNPAFELDVKKLNASLSEYDQKAESRMALLNEIKCAIDDKEERILIDTLIHTGRNDIFNPLTNEWAEQTKAENKQIDLDDEMAKMFLANHVITIVNLLLTSRKDTTDEVSLSIPGEGKYTLKPKGENVIIKFEAADEYKQRLKNDRLAASITD